MTASPAARRRARRAAAIAAGAALLGLAASAPAASALLGDGDGGFTFTPVGSFDRPTHADNAPGTGDALYVVESEGVIRVRTANGILPAPFLDIADIVRCCGEEGLLSVAFHPRYRRNRLFYVHFTDERGDNVVMEFKRRKKRPFSALRMSAREVLRIPHPSNSNHNGGQLQFGPDGYLYVAPGDGGSGGDPPNNAQNPGNLLGKLLRIDPRPACGKLPKKLRRKPKTKKARKRNAKKRKLFYAGCVKKRKAVKRFRAYSVPRDNPHVAGPGRDEVFALGLRNPWRFSFDAASGALAVGDVGQDCVEEINYLPRGWARGANFGWSRWEGTHLFNAGRSAPNATFPIHQYDSSHAGPGCPNFNNGFEGVSVVAGYVVRDPRLTRQFGRLLYTDAFNSEIRTLIPAPAAALDEQSTGLTAAGSVFSFAEGFANQLYIVTSSGPVYRLDPA